MFLPISASPVLKIVQLAAPALRKASAGEALGMRRIVRGQPQPSAPDRLVTEGLPLKPTLRLPSVAARHRDRI